MTNSDLELGTRRHKRIRTLKAGRVYYHVGRAAINCTIRDLTNEGAHLKFEHIFSGPDRLEFQIGYGDLVEARIGCQVRWRRDKEIGIRFDELQSVTPKIL